MDIGSIQYGGINKWDIGALQLAGEIIVPHSHPPLICSAIFLGTNFLLLLGLLILVL